MPSVAPATTDRQAREARERAFFALLGQAHATARGRGYSVCRLTPQEGGAIEVAVYPSGDRTAEPTVVRGADTHDLLAALAALPDHVTTTRHS